MSKNNRPGKSHAITGRKSASRPTGVTTTPGRTGSSPPPEGLSARGRWLLFGAVVLILGVGWGLYAAKEYGLLSSSGEQKKTTRRPPKDKEPRQPAWNGDFNELVGKMPPREPWKIEPWRPAGEKDHLIDRFVKQHRARDAAAAKSLAAQPAGDGPVDEEGFERWVAGLALREKGLSVRDVWKGEPDASGKPRPADGRYTLVMKGALNTPPAMRVRDTGGNVSTPSYSLVDPVIVVEVAGQTIRPLRAELNREP